MGPLLLLLVSSLFAGGLDTAGQLSHCARIITESRCINDPGSSPDCEYCQEPPRIKQPQSMAVNVKLVALDNSRAASITQSSAPNENEGGECGAALAAYSDAMHRTARAPRRPSVLLSVHVAPAAR